MLEVDEIYQFFLSRNISKLVQPKWPTW